MGDRSPRTFWDRLQRKVRGWLDDDDESGADDGSIAFSLVYVAPFLLALVILLRR
jgi:hypothetical protein